jgi:glutathione synthase/RimK-type ligase-like ATP-grasp enzyme
MKKILILVDKIGPKKELFAEEISKRLGKDVQVFMAKFSDLFFEIDRKNINIKIQDFPITDFDFVYFRRAGDRFSALASTLAICLKENGIKFIDSAWINIGPLGSKFTSLIKLAYAGLPIFPTIFVWPDNIDNYSEEIIKKLGLPIVAKELAMQRGKGVFLLKSKKDFAKLPMQDSRGGNNQFLFQKFVDLENEYRILVLGNKAAVWEKKIITTKGEFRHNISLGATEEFLPIKKIPPMIASIAVKGAKVLNLEVAGVDVATEKRTGKVYLVEVNRGPGITYDTKISPELHEIADFMARELK